MRRGRSLLLCGVLVVAGCSLPIHRQFQTVLLREGGDIEPLPVTLMDATGRLLALEPGDPDDIPWEGEASLAPGDPNAVAVFWLGGACDHGVTMRLEQSAAGYRVIGTTDRAGACVLVGIGRAVILRFGGPVDPAWFTVAIDQEIEPET